LLAQPTVSQAVALVADSPAGEQLVAYVVPKPGAEIDQAALLGLGVDMSDPALLLSAAGPVVAWLAHGAAKVTLNGLPPPKGRLP